VPVSKKRRIGKKIKKIKREKLSRRTKKLMNREAANL